jgi:hypothetical protein
VERLGAGTPSWSSMAHEHMYKLPESKGLPIKTCVYIRLSLFHKGSFVVSCFMSCFPETNWLIFMKLYINITPAETNKHLWHLLYIYVHATSRGSGMAPLTSGSWRLV